VEGEEQTNGVEDELVGTEHELHQNKKRKRNKKNQTVVKTEVEQTNGHNKEVSTNDIVDNNHSHLTKINNKKKKRNQITAQTNGHPEENGNRASEETTANEDISEAPVKKKGCRKKEIS